MEKLKQKHLILNDNLWQVTFKLSWPAILAMVLYGLNTVFDAFFVGRFVGEDALAGVSLAYPLTQLSLGLGSLIGVGAGSALSIAIGKNDTDTQKKLLGNVNYLSIVISLVFMMLGLIFTNQLIQFMGGSGLTLDFGAAYFRVTVYGALFWIAGLAGNMIVRAEGKMKTAALMMGIGLGVNIVFNYIFIVIFKWGVEGAAWGTNIGMIIYTLTSLVYFKREGASFEAKPFSIRRDKAIMKRIISMGVPSLIMSVMSLLQAVVVLNAISNYGSNSDLAFYGVAFRIFTFMLTPIFGLMRALQPVVGINYGAKNYERVIKGFKVFAVAATLVMLPFWLLMMIGPQLPLNLMMPDKVLAAQDLFNFRIFMALLPILPVIFMGMTFFPAIDKGKIASMIGIARQLVFYVPLMLILPRFFGVDFVYIGAFAIDFIIVLWSVYLVRKEFKALRELEEVDLNRSA
ncbi:MATE family efflux transporter [Acidaminobacter sp. JC074]|uniref:MATE family efflux transporter n=1 Tax=Acidaminobacter sp. JC074 TaxID=2530199 RepID=UPI001F0F0BF2|nr:MATE family efflux transporter [Acidaminobacter sp. JC074]MCH4889077.1 MATE family efflux transporter [Acidaminobacter sp. JC074]